MAHCFAAVPLGVGLLVSSALGADEKPPHPKPPKVQAQRPAAAARQAQKQAEKQQTQPDNRPGALLVEKLRKMSPEEREQKLHNLPEPQRQRIERQLNEFVKDPPRAQARALNRVERLQSLPPQRQNQVRRSVKQFQELPEERRSMVAQELRRIAPLPDDERRAYMNTEEFRNRYSANEQQIMSNLALIEPEVPPRN